MASLGSEYETHMSMEGAVKVAEKAYGVDPKGKGVYWTTDPSVELPIMVSRKPGHPASVMPVTVIDVLHESVRKHGDNVHMRVKREGKWQEWTFQRYYEEARAFGKACIKVGLERYQGVSIIGFNSPEWLIADVGTILAGGIAAGIYTTNGPEACHYIAEHCGAGIVVVEDEVQLEKFLQIRDRLPKLRTIVMWKGKVPDRVTGVYSWTEFLALGAREDDMALNDRMASQRPGQCCTLIYTSGTTGNPKAVMLSHDNITWSTKSIQSEFGAESTDGVVSYLPLSHIAAQMFDLHGPMRFGGTVTFAQPDALKGTLVETLNEARPTLMLGVPRVWEKIEEKMKAVGAANTGLKKMIGDWGKSVGLEGNLARLEGKSVPWSWMFANALVFSNVKKALGLDRCRLRITGAAPITMQTMHYFMSLDMPLLEVYGMSETSGLHTANLPGRVKLGSVGFVIPGADVRIDSPDKDGNGEICMRGRHIFMGYMHNEKATAGTVDEDGWLHSGDIGRMDEDGFVKITGRIKELIITAGGENVAPVLIEDVIKEELPCVSNAVVIGDKRKFLTCLITLKNEPDSDMQPTDALAGPALAFAKAAGSSATKVSEALACDKFKAAMQVGMDKANSRAISRAQCIRKWAILTTDFSVATNELTPTMKLKRRIVSKKYETVIESMYAETKLPKAKL